MSSSAADARPKSGQDRADPLADVTPERAAQVRLECVRTLYKQIPNSFAAAMGVTAYMVVTLWMSVPHRTIAVWLGIQGVAQAHRFLILFRYRRARIDTSNSHRWARHYALYMLSAGVVWALCPFLFFGESSVFAQLFTMCGLYGISAGSVPGNAYHPPAVRAFLVTIFGAVLLRMLLLSGTEYIALGVASFFFMLIMLAFCNVQHRSIIESIRTRFENIDLVEQLRVQKAAAEQARAHAEHADLAKSRFLAAASHDLRQPLHALGLFATTLRGLQLEPKQQGVVEQIHDNIDSLEALFDELLDISKLDAGFVRPALSHFPIQRVLDVIAGRFRGPAEEKGLELRMRRCEEVVVSDPALLERVLGNLVANAVRYTPSGSILVAGRRRGNRLSVEVWDTGVGIAADQQERIFEEFFQIGNPERDRRKGLGLGLAIARRTALLLGCTIELRSVPLRGSMFRVRVELGDPTAVANESPKHQSLGDALAGKCVLVVDDEASIREGMRELLMQWSCRAVVAADTGEAIAMLDRGGMKPHLIIADYRLRGSETGAHTVETLRRRFGQSVPGLLITGDTAPERLLETRQSGLHVLHKPVRPAQLRALCNFLLTKSESQCGDAAASPG